MTSPVGGLILIEGMIGAGKSTTAAGVGRRLAEQGYDAVAYHEFADDHPIRTSAVDRLRAASPEVVGSASVPEAGGVPREDGIYAVDQWRVLAERCCRERRTTILESTFLQNSVLPGFIHGASIEQVRDRFSRIAGLIAPARPLLVYLRPSDIEAAVRRAHRERGEPWASWNVASVVASPWARARSQSGPEAVVAFYRDWERVVEELLDAYSSPKLVLVDPQADWERTLARIVAAARA
jgi:hypothetical protein